MKLYTFIRAAEIMRKGGVPCIHQPRGMGRIRGRHHVDRKLTEAYSALFRFRIKHPDSDRQNKTRQRDLQRFKARVLREML